MSNKSRRHGNQLAPLSSALVQKAARSCRLSWWCSLSLVIIVLWERIYLHSEVGVRSREGKRSQAKTTNPWTTNYHFRNKDDPKCSLTVVILDPRLPYFPANDTIFTKTLESVAEYIPNDSCILLQISLCLLHNCRRKGGDPKKFDQILYIDDETLPAKQKPASSGFDPTVLASCSHKKQTSIESSEIPSLLLIAASQIERRSGPILRKKFWESGRIRLSLLNHTRYSRPACDNFSPPNSILRSKHYWVDEFVPEDSDQILFIQRDVFLCKSMHLHTWRHLAYVGAPWPKDFPWMGIAFRKKNIEFSPERISIKPNLTAWQDYWNRLDDHDTGYLSEIPTSCNNIESQVNNINCPLPALPPILTFPDKLQERIHWVGNGGFSLRSRKWMVRMIRLCPQQGQQMSNVACISKAMQEDMFFSLLLTLVGAPIATPVEAALFSMDQDSVWPDQIIGEGRVPPELAHDFQREVQELGHAVPFGQHKCYLSFIAGNYACVEQEWCKYSFNTEKRPTKVLQKVQFSM